MTNYWEKLYLLNMALIAAFARVALWEISLKKKHEIQP